MFVSVPLVLALVTKDHITSCLWGAHGGQVAVTTRVLVAICNKGARLTKPMVVCGVVGRDRGAEGRKVDWKTVGSAGESASVRRREASWRKRL